MQKHRQKDHGAKPGRNKKARCDSDAVKKSVNGQAKENGVVCVMEAHFLQMSFLAKVKMRRKRMLEKMYEEVADQHEEVSCVPSQTYGLRNHIRESHREHIA